MRYKQSTSTVRLVSVSPPTFFDRNFQSADLPRIGPLPLQEATVITHDGLRVIPKRERERKKEMEDERERVRQRERERGRM